MDDDKCILTAENSQRIEYTGSQKAKYSKDKEPPGKYML